MSLFKNKISARHSKHTGDPGPVKLRHRLCETCTDALLRCCEPYTLQWGQWTYENKRWITGRVGSHQDGVPEWIWLAHQLTASAQTCVFCRFLQESLKASPWISYEANDYIILKSHFLGSEHESEYSGYDQSSQYRRYYRPRLQVYNKRDGESYITGESTFLLPLSQSTDQWEDADTPQTFDGRVVGGKVDFSLLRRWFDACRTKHDGRTQESASADKYRPIYGQSQSPPSCCPKLLPPIANFRLIDVKKRCVVMAEPPSEYAALSYVWGDAKRLLLCNDTLERLSTPNALDHDQDALTPTFRDALEVADQLGIPYLWIDGLCILQDNEEQLEEHMNIMDIIYGCATLTIVSNTESAATGIPGIGSSRVPDQVVFRYGSKAFISSKQTFGKALIDSPWETRAWCLQEKIFSKRLLIFTESQAFYHCSCATWFEDTVLESGGSSGNVYLAERSDPSRKGPRSETFAAYEAHRPLFGRNFWSLVEIYSQRQLSFERDAIRAFSGILRSIESKYGSSIWGVPQYLFARGLTWSYSNPSIRLRRKEFPSWSWAGWGGNTGARIRFNDALTRGTEPFNLQWHYYTLNDSNKYELRTVGSSKGPDNVMRRNVKNQIENDSISLSDHSDREDDSFGIADHPGGSSFTGLPMPPFNHDPKTMPPLSHILRFWTSSVMLAIDSAPDPMWSHYGKSNNIYSICIPGHSGHKIGEIELDGDWAGRHCGMGEFIFISLGFLPPSDSPDLEPQPILLNVMLIEWVGDVAYRVQMCRLIDIHEWRKARPVWKLITLA